MTGRARATLTLCLFRQIPPKLNPPIIRLSIFCLECGRYGLFFVFCASLLACLLCCCCSCCKYTSAGSLLFKKFLYGIPNSCFQQTRGDWPIIDTYINSKFTFLSFEFMKPFPPLFPLKAAIMKWSVTLKLSPAEAFGAGRSLFLLVSLVVKIIPRTLRSTIL